MSTKYPELAARAEQVLWDLTYREPPVNAVSLARHITAEQWQCVFDLWHAVETVDDFFDLLRPYFRDWQDKYNKIVDVAQAHGYAFTRISDYPDVLGDRRAFLYHDIHPEDIFPALAIIDVNRQRGLATTFFLNWDFAPLDIEYRDQYRFLRNFEGPNVEIGLHTFAFASYLIWKVFDGDERAYFRWLDGGTAQEDLLSLKVEPAEIFAGRDFESLFEDIKAWFCDYLEVFRQEFPTAKAINPHGSPIIRLMDRMSRENIDKDFYDRFHGGLFVNYVDIERWGYELNLTRFFIATAAPCAALWKAAKCNTTKRRWIVPSRPSCQPSS